MSVDPLNFRDEYLPNGIRLITKTVDLPFTSVRVWFPLGSSHNTNGIKGGTAHFLEHALFNGTEGWDHTESFDEAVTATGGNLNASTSRHRTKYKFSVPNEYLPELLPAFARFLLYPSLKESELDRERTVIGNERKRSSRWWPGGNEVSQYLSTTWFNGMPLTIEQVFGSDEDLATMTSDDLRHFHQLYNREGVIIFAIGGGDITPLIAAFSNLTLQKDILPFHENKLGWNHPEYHEVAFRDVSRPNYHFEGYMPYQPPLQQARGMRFILNYVTNASTGPIYRWLREEKGWTYDIHYSSNVARKAYSWGIEVPLNEYEQIAVVRSELQGRIATALEDAPAIEKVLKRYLGGMAYDYHDPLEAFGTVLEQIELFDRIIPSAESLEIVHSVANPATLQQIWDEVVTKGDTGEIAILPKPHES